MELSASLTAAATLNVEVRTRHYFSSEHLWTAQDGAVRCRGLETALRGVRSIDIAHRASCTTAVMSSVAFLEAFINEVFEDAADAQNASVRVGTLSAESRSHLASYYRDGGERDRVLDKYQRALDLLNLPVMDRGREPYQSAKALVAWRNALTHFKPDWHDDGNGEKWERALQARFEASTLLANNDGSPWFPIKAFGAGGAEWAVRTADRFASDWADVAGVPRTWEGDLQQWRETYAPPGGAD